MHHVRTLARACKYGYKPAKEWSLVKTLTFQNVLEQPIRKKSEYKRKTIQNCCFPWLQSPQRHRLFTGADGTDVPSLLTQQACAIPPLLELCAPSHRNSDVVTSGASPIHNLKVTIVISAVLYRQEIKLLKSGVLVSLTRWLPGNPMGLTPFSVDFFTENAKILTVNVLNGCAQHARRHVERWFITPLNA